MKKSPATAQTCRTDAAGGGMLCVALFRAAVNGHVVAGETHWEVTRDFLAFALPWRYKAASTRSRMRLGRSSGHCATACDVMPTASAAAVVVPPSSFMASDFFIVPRLKHTLTALDKHSFKRGCSVSDMSYGKRLKAALAYAKKERKELAAAIGISVQAIGATIRGETGAMTAENNAKAAAFLRVNAHWLATEEGEMVLPQTEKNNVIPQIGDGHTAHGLQNVTPIAPRKKVPVISWVAAGAWSEVEDMYLPGEAERWADVYESDPSGNAFALVVEGDSMKSPYPDGLTFLPGTIIVVDPNRSASAGDFVVAKDVMTQKATFKKLVYDAGRWFLKPLNPAYPTIEIDDPAIRVIGRVIEYRTGGKL